MITKPDLLFRRGIEEIADENELTFPLVQRIKEEKKTLEIFKIDDNALRQLDKELVSAFSPNVQTFASFQFVKDLGIDVFMKSFMQPRYAPNYVLNALARAPVDISTIHYRWAVIDDLMEDRQKLALLNDIGKELGELTKELHNRKQLFCESCNNLYLWDHEQTTKFLLSSLKILGHYTQSIEDIESALAGSRSEALANVHEYAKKIKETERYKLICEAIIRFAKEQYVEIGITLDGLKRIKKVEYLGIGKHQLDTGMIGRIANGVFNKDNLRNVLNHPNFMMFGMNYLKILMMAIDGLVKSSLKQIETTTMLLGDIDFYDGAIRYHDILKKNGLPATRPELLSKEHRKQEIKGMYNPLINYEIEHNNCSGIYCSGNCSEVKIREEIVPNGFYVDPTHNILVITGPNNGGKTRVSTGIGLVIATAQSGLHVPVEFARLSLVDNTYTHFVSPDATDNKSGRWVNEVLRINKKLKGTTPYSLSIIDDFGSGTNYLEAREPALAVIYGHYRVGATLIMNTHLHQLADDIENGQFPTASNWQVEIDDTGKDLVYTYKVVPGKAGKSYAKNIAASYGLSKEAIDQMISRRIENGELPSELVKPAQEIRIE